MAYFILTHGVGTDPAQFITMEFRDYKKAKTALTFLFDSYQEILETTPGIKFTCILKTKGVLNNGNTEKEKDQTGKRKDKEN